MPAIRANGITLDYAEEGPTEGPPLLLIRGLGTQHTMWPRAFLDALIGRGLRVIRYDNRDAGLSAKLDTMPREAVALAIGRALGGEPVEPPYTLDDMARDAIGLIDARGIDAAHVVGISMGGMIAQVLAAAHVTRVRSLVSIMSSSGNPALPPGEPEAMRAMLSQPERPDDRDSVIAHTVHVQRVIGSPGFPTEEAELRRVAAAAYDRCHCPDGVSRQLLAVLASGSRVERLRQIVVPALVIHGADDPLVPLEAGRDTARCIPGAVLRVVPGMGHDLAPGLVPILVDAIVHHVESAENHPR